MNLHRCRMSACEIAGCVLRDYTFCKDILIISKVKLRDSILTWIDTDRGHCETLGAKIVKSTAIVALMLVLIAFGANATSLPQPTGDVVLTVSGNITNTNVGNEAHFDRQMLDDLGRTTIETHTSWTDGLTSFQGVLGSRVLEAVGANGSEVVGTALDEYNSVIPISDFVDYSVLLATTMNGKDFTRRDWGPMWIMYPWDDFDELRVENKFALAVWQLTRLEIR